MAEEIVLYEDSIDGSDKLLLKSESSDLDECEDVTELLSEDWDDDEDEYTLEDESEEEMVEDEEE